MPPTQPPIQQNSAERGKCHQNGNKIVSDLVLVGFVAADVRPSPLNLLLAHFGPHNQREIVRIGAEKSELIDLL